jgi:hypothetical protein
VALFPDTISARRLAPPGLLPRVARLEKPGNFYFSYRS